MKDRALVTWPAQWKWLAIVLNYWFRASLVVVLVGIGLLIAGKAPTTLVLGFTSAFVALFSSLLAIRQLQVKP